MSNNVCYCLWHLQCLHLLSCKYRQANQRLYHFSIYQVHGIVSFYSSMPSLISLRRGGKASTAAKACSYANVHTTSRVLSSIASQRSSGWSLMTATDTDVDHNASSTAVGNLTHVVHQQPKGVLSPDFALYTSAAALNAAQLLRESGHVRSP